jgi:LysM repeat protein
MKTFKLTILLILGLLIFGSAGFFGYELFIKPGRVEKRERIAAANAPAPTPTPDPGAPELARLKALRQSGKTAEARDGLTAWTTTYTASPLLPEARRELGAANMTLLFQQGANPSLVTYTVVKGDSLAKIASKHHSSAELIQKANQLPNINLQIGQQLVIPSLKTSLEIDRAAKTLTILDNGAYLKEYLLLSAPPAPKTPSNISSKILDKVVTSGNKRIAFGDKAYAAAGKTILLAQSPAIVGATPPSAPVTPPADGVTNAVTAPSPQLPGGYVLRIEEFEELFPLVSRNTPVIIH